jgi:hypothetical protein
VIGTSPIARIENLWLQSGVWPYQRDHRPDDRPIVIVVLVSRLAHRAVRQVGGETALSDGRRRNAGTPGCRANLPIGRRVRGRRSAQERQCD